MVCIVVTKSFIQIVHTQFMYDMSTGKNAYKVHQHAKGT